MIPLARARIKIGAIYGEVLVGVVKGLSENSFLGTGVAGDRVNVVTRAQKAKEFEELKCMVKKMATGLISKPLISHRGS